MKKLPCKACHNMHHGIKTMRPVPHTCSPEQRKSYINGLKLKKAIGEVFKLFENSAADIVIIANYGDGNGGIKYDFKGDQKTMLPAIIFEAMRADKEFREAVVLAHKCCIAEEVGMIDLPHT